MFGKTEWIQFAVIGLSVICMATDLIQGKIYNAVLLPFFFIGFLASLIWDGWAGIGYSLVGALSGLFLFGWIFALRHMGGGDVKFLMVLGVWAGWPFALQVAVMSVLIGGIGSVILLLIKGKLSSFIQRLQVTLTSLFFKELEFQPFKVDESITMPFGIPIGLAAIWTIYAHPLERLGLFGW